MKPKNNLITILLLLLSFAVLGQEEYKYKSEVKGINDKWHTLPLPDTIYSKLQANLADLRIKGITAKNDTVEAPYLLKVAREYSETKEIAFTALNTSFNANGYFYTFQLKDNKPVNRLKLNFDTPNFDWLVSLEGSPDGKKWFTVLEDYRIVSIKNKTTDFKFTTLSFPQTTYSFLRMQVKSNNDPLLMAASVLKKEMTEGLYNNFSIETINVENNKTNRTTEITVELPLKVPVSKLAIGVTDDFDYYRRISIQYLADSVKTEKGWYYSYKPLTSGTLHSINGNEFTFVSTVLKKLKVVVYNNDNEPLNFGDFNVRGYKHALLARFTTPATYYLVYGSKRVVARPDYDILQFVDNIPENLSALSLGKEQLIKSSFDLKREALFENDAWLWAVMALIIIILAGFTFKMLKKEG